MRSRSTAVLSLTAVAALALAGCATQPASDGAGTAEPSPTASVAESSYASPAVAGERTGVNGADLQLWSSVAPDEAAIATLGDPEAGTQWVTVNVAQWTADKDQTDVDIAPVLRSSTDESFTGTAVSPRAVDVPMTADKLYTFAWSFQVPENLVDATSLVLCTSADADAACTSIDK